MIWKFNNSRNLSTVNGTEHLRQVNCPGCKSNAFTYMDETKTLSEIKKDKELLKG